MENRVTEYVDHLHEHFVEPVMIRNAHYVPPQKPGYSITIKPETRVNYRFPDGSVWKQ
jgi:L-fuconate dehydratase